VAAIPGTVSYLPCRGQKSRAGRRQRTARGGQAHRRGVRASRSRLSSSKHAPDLPCGCRASSRRALWSSMSVTRCGWRRGWGEMIGRRVSGDAGSPTHHPWRKDPRPLEGLLQGIYAHLAISKFWGSLTGPRSHRSHRSHCAELDVLKLMQEQQPRVTGSAGNAAPLTPKPCRAAALTSDPAVAIGISVVRPAASAGA
jgi:hypothetical protein